MARKKHKHWITMVVVAIAALVTHYFPDLTSATRLEQGNNTTIQRAISQQQRDVQVEVSAQVVKVLRDDNEGSRHQRFLIKLASDTTILVAHNIDLAPRVKDLQRGDTVTVFGEYIWNKKGGVLHWTHHDPNGHHTGGWIKHAGQIYQ